MAATAVEHNKSRTGSTPRAATGTLATMIACNVCSGQAFQSSFFVPMQDTTSYAAAFSRPTMAATTMRFSSPWDVDCGGNQPFRVGGLRGRRALNPIIFGDPSAFQEHQLNVKDPEVVETDGSYHMTFDLPADVEQDGFDVSVNDRLLTVKARVTREDSRDVAERGGWVTRSSTTNSVSRSFVLPKYVSASSVKASWISDGKVEVRFKKDAAAAESATDRAGTAAGAPGATPNADANKTPTTSTSAEYLSSLSETTTARQAKAGVNAGAPAVDPSAETSQSQEVPVGKESHARPRSVFDALDGDFSSFAKAVWGEDVFNFRTDEEMIESFEAATERRTKRVMAIRRATMATDVSDEKEGSYLVKIDLPEGATREDVKLTLTSDKTLRISFAAKGRRSIYKDVRLPKDALLSEVAAKFEAEKEEQDEKQEEGGTRQYVSAKTGLVSSLHVTVGRTVRPDPTRIDIM